MPANEMIMNDNDWNKEIYNILVDFFWKLKSLHSTSHNIKWAKNYEDFSFQITSPKIDVIEV